MSKQIRYGKSPLVSLMEQATRKQFEERYGPGNPELRALPPVAEERIAAIYEGIEVPDLYIEDEAVDITDEQLEEFDRVMASCSDRQTTESPKQPHSTTTGILSEPEANNPPQMHAPDGLDTSHWELDQSQARAMLAQEKSESIRVLETSFNVDTAGFRQGSPAYLLAVSCKPNAGLPRVKVLAMARDGVYREIWQRRNYFGAFRPVDVSPANPLHHRLRTEADVEGIAKAMVERGVI